MSKKHNVSIACFLLWLLTMLSGCNINQASKVEIVPTVPDRTYAVAENPIPFPSVEDINELNKEFYQIELEACAKIEFNNDENRAVIQAFDERAFQYLTWFRYDLKGYEIIKAASNWQENYVSPTDLIDLSYYTPSEQFKKLVGGLQDLFDFREHKVQIIPYPKYEEEFIKIIVSDDEAFEFAWQMRILNPEITVIEYQ